MYCYCYYCEKYLTIFGQATRCPDCQSEVASLSTCGRIHYQTETRLLAEAQRRKQKENAL